MTCFYRDGLLMKSSTKSLDWLVTEIEISNFYLLSFTVASSLHFDGTQYMKISMPGESKTEVEDISLRFNTVRPHGLLFLTASEETKDIMELLLESGAIKLKLNLGSGTRVSSWKEF